MITMDMLGKIRRLRFRDGLSVGEIVWRTGLSRNTVKSWLKAGEGTVPKYRRHKATTVLAPYQDRLLQWLEADARPAQRRQNCVFAHRCVFRSTIGENMGLGSSDRPQILQH
jgi:transposase